MTILTQLAWITGVSLGVTLVLWLVQRRTGDGGIIDVGWSYLLAASAIFAAATGAGDVERRILLGTVVGIWGIRLGTHLLIDRVLAEHEDGRYTMLREYAGAKIQPVLFAFFLGQGVLVGILAITFVIGTASPKPLDVFAYGGAALWIIGLVGETIADRQLRAFKQRGNDGVCEEGLWRYSRHPNYFFEWLMWIAYGLIAMSGPHGWLAWIAPALMLLLMLKATGIPPTEARAIRSRGDAYRRYQRTTSAFVPWFRRTLNEADG